MFSNLHPQLVFIHHSQYTHLPFSNQNKITYNYNQRYSHHQFSQTYQNNFMQHTPTYYQFLQRNYRTSTTIRTQPTQTQLHSLRPIPKPTTFQAKKKKKSEIFKRQKSRSRTPQFKAIGKTHSQQYDKYSIKKIQKRNSQNVFQKVKNTRQKQKETDIELQYPKIQKFKKQKEQQFCQNVLQSINQDLLLNTWDMEPTF